MNTEEFVSALPSLFDGRLDADHPCDRRFHSLMEDVPGMASENKLAVLNLAAGLLPEDEAYLEVGAWKGLSIIAAMLGHDHSRFYAIENFACFGVDPWQARRELLDNARRWEVLERLTLIDADAFVALAAPDWLRQPVGVYFYDGSHDRLAHHLALGMAEPLLAEEALVVVDDTSWAVVAGATDRYVAGHDGYKLLLDFESPEESDPRWWNGVRVYRYRRPARRRERRLDLAWRRSAYLWLYAPATRALSRAAAKAVAGRPALTSAACRVASTVGRHRRA